MSLLQILLITLALVFVVLLLMGPKYRKISSLYFRYTVLIGAGLVVLMPFFWLLSASLKDQKVFNDYTFLPPLHTWFEKEKVEYRDVKDWNRLLENLRKSESNKEEEARVWLKLSSGLQSKLTQALDSKRDIHEAEKELVLMELNQTYSRNSLEEYFPASVHMDRTVNFDHFVKLFAAKETMHGKVYFWQYILNSVFLASCVTILQLFFSSLGGFAMAKYEFRGKKFLMFFMLGTMMIPGMLFLPPVYELIVNIGWVDSYLALVVPGLVSVFGIFLFRQAMVGLPNDLIEAARVDGCSEFKIYFSLIMPLVRPMSGAFCLVTFLASWNNFLSPQIFIHSESKLTLPVVLTQYIGFYAQDYGVFLAGTMLAIIPPAILFFALQKEFISGLTSGAVKG